MLPLSPPPRDACGNVEPHDHSQIQSADLVIRRINKEWAVDDGTGGWRVSSMAFKASSGLNGGMSVDIERLINEAKIDPRSFVSTPVFTGAVSFEAQQLRGLGFMVGYDPLPPDNPYHGEVWGKFSSSNVKKLKNAAAWYIPIPDVHL